MRIYLFLFALLSLLGFISCKENDLIPQTRNYSSGNKQASYFTNKQGEITGTYIEYFQSGKVQSRKEFDRNLEVGKATFYYENGQLREVQYFKDGKKHGGDTLFDVNGRIRNLSNFVDGKMHGTFIKFKDGSDSIDLETTYLNDSLISVKKY
jgi:antitoxin component YwqK of YwqJK toxin-antitoxin module